MPSGSPTTRSPLHRQAKGAGTAHCPSSNTKLASGVSPVPKLRKAGVRVGLGTDGPASNNDLDLFEEIDLALKLHKITTGRPRGAHARDGVEMATLGGARALHLEKEIGSLEPGKRADLIVLADRLALGPADVRRLLAPRLRPEGHRRGDDRGQRTRAHGGPAHADPRHARRSRPRRANTATASRPASPAPDEHERPADPPDRRRSRVRGRPSRRNRTRRLRLRRRHGRSRGPAAPPPPQPTTS